MTYVEGFEMHLLGAVRHVVYVVLFVLCGHHYRQLYAEPHSPSLEYVPSVEGVM